MQQISGTIRIYWNSSKKIDFIMKQTYNKGLDIRCVGAGISKDTGNTYLLFLASDDLFLCLEEFNNRIKQSEFAREYQ